jgi:hypothetical protein
VKRGLEFDESISLLDLVACSAAAIIGIRFPGLAG